MKFVKLISLTKNFSLTIVIIPFVFLLSACAKKTVFLTSTFLPTTSGSVKIGRDIKRRYVINIQLDNLTNPSNLQPPKTAYVVWMVTQNNTSKNIGQILYIDNIAYQKYVTTFKAVSSVKPLRVFITGENDPKVQTTVSQVVLSTDNF